MNVPLLRALVNGTLADIVAGERADRVLARTLRAHRGLTSEERARVADWTLGIALWRGRLDTMARGDRSLWLGLFLCDREHLALDEAAEIAGVPAAVLRGALETPAPTDAAVRLAFERSLPRWMAERWIALWGVERADRLASAMNERGPITLRANLLRTTRDELIDRLASEGVQARPAAHAATALHLEGRPNIVALDSWRDGWFEVQDEGSQLVADAAGARPGQTIVDLCAGSGGKTLALAARMGNRGRLIAIDPDQQRLADLRVRAKRAGAACVEVRHGDARDEALTADLAGLADAVLVDAPCSAIGTLRRGPDARWRIASSETARWALLQVNLLHVGVRLMRAGGRLVYATCSLDPSENEGVSGAVNVQGLTITEQWTVAPDTHGCDGFFCALFSRAPTS